MKYIYLTLLLIIPLSLFADQYVVEWKEVDGKKVQVSSYTLPDGEAVDTDNAYTLVTAEEYALLGDGKDWEKNTTEWLKTPANVSKVDTAITNKPKSDAEKLAKLEAKVLALEEAKATQ